MKKLIKSVLALFGLFALFSCSQTVDEYKYNNDIVLGEMKITYIEFFKEINDEVDEWRKDWISLNPIDTYKNKNTDSRIFYMSELPEENKNLYVDSKLHNKKNFDNVLLLKYYFETNDNKYTEFNSDYIMNNGNSDIIHSLFAITENDNLNDFISERTYNDDKQEAFFSTTNTIFKLEFVEEKDNYMIFENKYFGKIKLVLDK